MGFRRSTARAFATLWVLAVSAGVLAHAAGAAHRSHAAPVRLASACLPLGGVEVTFVIENIGRRSLSIDQDFHLALTVVRSGGPEVAGIAFVFPIPELATIAPGGRSTFVVPIGDPIEPGEVGANLSGHRVLLEAEVFIEGRRKPARRLFSFPACPSPG